MESKHNLQRALRIRLTIKKKPQIAKYPYTILASLQPAAELPYGRQYT